MKAPHVAAGLLARPLLAPVFVVGGIDTLRDPEPRAEMAVPFLKRIGATALADPVTLVRANAALQVGAGVTLALGVLPRASAVALVGSLVPTTLAGHRFWAGEDAKARKVQLIQFAKNAAIVGGLLHVAATRRS